MNKNIEFIEKANQIHNNKYDYSKVDYVNTKIKVEIICPEHGSFWQTPSNHVTLKHGCPKCGKKQSAEKHKIGTDKFIQKSKEIHSERYDYSKVHYINCFTPVTIICPIHGEFQQKPTFHLAGSNCPKCSNKYVPTTKEWIIKAKEIHNNKYDYSKVKYVNAHTPIKIICPEHGEFEQSPNNHINGSGCPECGKLLMIKKNSFTQEEFIEKAKKIHMNRYDYSKVNYINVRTPIIIRCKKHGEFKQLPSDHLRGSGCPLCSKSHGEITIENYLINNNIKYIAEYEINIDKSINPSGIAKIDFYLPDYNMFIEYNGKQHYTEINHFGGKIGLERQKNRDSYVQNYCNKNSICLIIIKYDENILEKLNNIVKGYEF